MREKRNGTTLVIWSAVMNILLGLLLLIVPQVEITQLVYVMSAVLVAMGIIYIVKYFMKESFRELNCYHFSLGVLLVVLGMCALIRTEQVAVYLTLCFELMLLVSAVVKLQNALDLKAMHHEYWAGFLAVAAFMMVCAVLLLLNPFGNETDTQVFTYVMLVIDGVLGIVETFYLSAYIKKYVKYENAELIKALEDGEYEDAEETGSTESE